MPACAAGGFSEHPVIQLTQKLGSGAMNLIEVPAPACAAGMVVVRNHYSLISPGTEGATVKAARAGIVEKVQARPEQVRQVLEVSRMQGPLAAYRAVMKKLGAHSPLGYSSAGEVVETGRGVTSFKIGDKAACAGTGYANHAEIVAVPENLCVRLPEEAELKPACYNTLGAIAMQGVRQADLRLGEACAVIGLGLLGQLTCLLLRAAGIQVYGIDIEEAAVEKARRHCADNAWSRTTPGLEALIEGVTGGIGVDAVIITAGTDSLDPINLAGSLARKRGVVVVVGDAPTGFDRNPHWYRKELQLRMSCSYGPGRYDPEYEEKGRDYPVAHVRWTEKRNMAAFQSMIHSGRIDLDYLTTHEIAFAEAPQAYEMILNRTEPFLGVVLRYDVAKPFRREPLYLSTAQGAGKVGLAFIGAGSYAQSQLLPYLSQNPSIARIALMTQSGSSARGAAEKFGFQICSCREEDVLHNENVNTVMIATRHDTHASYTIKALQKGRNVFVEKPLCVRSVELHDIETVMSEAASNGSKTSPMLMVGFNRRFSPLSRELKSRLSDAPVSMLYRINAGAIPQSHWIQDPQTGGGRIVGEACHFIDLLTFFSGSMPVRVFASAMADASELQDTVSINLEFENGSVGVVMYCANGPKSMPKEYLEVFQARQTGIIDDFKRLTLHGGPSTFKKRLLVQDKGQKDMVRQFLERAARGGAPLIPLTELFAVTRATFAVLESLRCRRPVALSEI